jgi:geranylgeranyl diphosphate synthase, type I
MPSPALAGSPQRLSRRVESLVARWHSHTEVVPASQGLRACRTLDEVDRLMLELAGEATRAVLSRIAVEHLGTGGKRLRARLSLAALEAMGRPRSLGTGWAAACELLHNATLIHDDLQDGDAARRGCPTVWARHGAAQAINAGDLLLMLPFVALERIDTEDGVRWQLTRTLAECATQMAHGQAAEIGLDRTREVDWPTYRRIVAGKTGALFQLPVEGSALLAGHSPAVARALAREFQRLGVMFQLQDDLLDLYGEKGRDAVGSDLREGKVTALVIEHLRRAPADREWLTALLLAPRDRTPDTDVQEAIRRFRVSGALTAVLGRIATEVGSVAASAALATEPALRRLALDLVQEVLKPIGHLFGHLPEAEALELDHSTETLVVEEVA